jgi:hypothetical protein
VIQVACCYRGPFEEAAAGYGAQVSRIAIPGDADFPSGTAFYLNDSASGANTTFEPAWMLGVSTPTIGWPMFIFRIMTHMGNSTSIYLMRTQNQAANRPGIITLTRSAGGVYNLNIADLGGVVLATGATSLAFATGYTVKAVIDDSGANRAFTVYLWNGSAWVQEVTYTGGGVGATPFPLGFGHNRAKGAAASGGIFYVGNIYVPVNNGTEENSDPTKPRYLKGGAIDGVGHLDEWPGAAADVDDAATNDGDTTYDESGVGTGLERQTYTVGDPSIPAGQDVVHVSSHSAVRLSAGTASDCNAIFSDGTNDVTGQTEAAIGISYAQLSYGRTLAPDGGALSATTVANLEVGWQRVADASDPMNLRLSCIHSLVAYKEQDAAGGRSQACLI